VEDVVCLCFVLFSIFYLRGRRARIATGVVGVERNGFPLGNFPGIFQCAISNCFLTFYERFKSGKKGEDLTIVVKV
jgi:hypothetical protein